MQLPDKKVLEFLKKHHVLTLATTAENQPWCANCFYAFAESEMAFVFTSSDDTRHIGEVNRNSRVAGSVVLETNVVGKIQGVQFTGVLLPVDKENSSVSHLYLKRFPFAALMDTTLWLLKIDYLKMTDNRLGFGKKIHWNRNDASEVKQHL